MNHRNQTTKLTSVKAQVSVEYAALTLTMLAGGWWVFSSDFFSNFIDTVADQLFTTLIIINLPL